jgi:hypothetical protein
MLRFHDRFLVIAVLACVAGCGDAKVAYNRNDAGPSTQNLDSTSDTPAESTVLKQEMIDATVELMQAQKPDADPEASRVHVQQLVEAGIVEIRKHHPQFLIVSSDTEKRLQSGTPVPDAAERIADAERSLVESGAESPELVTVMLAQHKAGTLSPGRTELLAHLIVGAVKAHEVASTN